MKRGRGEDDDDDSNDGDPNNNSSDEEEEVVVDQSASIERMHRACANFEAEIECQKKSITVLSGQVECLEWSKR